MEQTRDALARGGVTVARDVEVLHDLSQYMVLEPGDLINTGTPQGFALSGRFPYLEADDVMKVGIEGLGEQKQRLVPAAR